MLSSPTRRARSVFAPLAALALLTAAPAQLVAQATGAEAVRPMTFLDMQHFRSAGSPTPSPDGKQLLYTVSTPDWKEARRQTDIHLVSLERGLPSTKQLTFTTEKNETSPQWSRDGSVFFFLSNRDAPSASSSQNQLYMMRTDGGEARRVTDVKDGVSNYSLTRDGQWLVYRSGKSGEEQLYRVPVADIAEAKAEQLTKQTAGVGSWEIAPDNRRIYFITADTVDADEKQRREKRFTVDVRNAETPLSSLWAVEMEPVQVTRLTRDTTITVASFTVSGDSRWVGFRAVSADRYKRNITEQFINADLFLLNVASGDIERLTNNEEVSEGVPEFSPDGRYVAFTAPADMTRYNMGNTRV